MPTATDGLRWKLRRPAPAMRGELADTLRISPVTAQLLINRGLTEAGAAGRFLDASFEHIHQPELLADMDKAVARLLTAVSKRQKVLVYGDADADGLAATAILARILRMLGCPVDTFIPCRLADGYGLSSETIERILADKPDLVVTVDCGITSREETALLTRAGVDVIVSDHHQPRGELPEVLAVVAPRRPGSSYPFPDICGATVAFKLAWGLAQALSPGRRVSKECRDFLNDATALVALGTVADVCPLVDENRVLVRYGLKALAASRHAGLASLVAASRRRYNASARRGLTARDVAWGLAPAVNSAGRLGQPEVALALLMAAEAVEAERLAAELTGLNEKRRSLGRIVADQAMAAAEAEREGPAIVLGSDSWHGGVVGLAAAKLSERFGRPAAVVAFDGEHGRGSARGPKGSCLHELFAACGEHLEDHGGHDGAAGFTVRRGSFEHFKAAFLKIAGERLTTAAQAEPALDIEAEVPAAELSRQLATEVEKLAPFGEANPEPTFATLGVRLAGVPQTIGSGRSLSFRIRAGEGSVRAVGFGWGQHIAEIGELGRAGRLDLAYRLQVDDRSGEPELHLEAFRSRV